MFTWKVENLELMNNGFVGDKDFSLKNAFYAANEYEFKCEKQVSTEDKIAFIDSMQDNKMSYFIDLNEKYEKAKPNLRKDKKGNVTDATKATWLKKNDTRGLVFDRRCSNSYKEILITGCKQHMTRTVNKFFHEQLIECFFSEIKYSLEHDEDYQVVKSVCESLKKYGYASNYVFNVANGYRIVPRYSGVIDWWSIDLYDEEDSKIELSVDEVKMLSDTLAFVEEKHQNLLKAQAEMSQALENAGAEFIRKIGF